MTNFLRRASIVFLLCAASSSYAGFLEICQRGLSAVVKPWAGRSLLPIARVNIRHVQSRDLAKGAATESTIEPNAFWDTNIFGGGYHSRRPSTSYSTVFVSREGEFLSDWVDYESIRPSMRKTLTRRGLDPLEVHIAHRDLRPDSRTVILLPGSLSPEAREAVVTSMFHKDSFFRSGRPALVFSRRFSDRESELMGTLNQVALNYRYWLRTQLDEVERQLRSRSSPELMARRQDLIDQILELSTLHRIDLPPFSEDSGLLYSGKGAPPVPPDAALQPMGDPRGVGTAFRYGAERRLDGTVRIVEFRHQPGSDTVEIVDLTVYGGTKLKADYGRDMVLPTYRWSESTEVTAPVERVSVAEFNNRKDSFRILSRPPYSNRG